MPDVTAADNVALAAAGVLSRSAAARWVLLATILGAGLSMLDSPSVRGGGWLSPGAGVGRQDHTSAAYARPEVRQGHRQPAGRGPARRRVRGLRHRWRRAGGPAMGGPTLEALEGPVTIELGSESLEAKHRVHPGPG